LISCNREGEKPNPRGAVVDWYNDSPAPIFRKVKGVRFDTDFIFTGWQDVDIGLQYEAHGYRVVRDRRTSINHEFADFGAKTTFYHVWNHRNKLLMDIKWHIGHNDWKGVDAYNKTQPDEKKIPTLYDLAGFSEQQSKLFCESIETEMTRFIHGDNPNHSWRRPW